MLKKIQMMINRKRKVLPEKVTVECFIRTVELPIEAFAVSVMKSG